jgi:nicotinamidase-related amidase
MTDSTTPRFIKDWLATIPVASFSEVAPDPGAAAVFSADMINGFVHFGPLASPRVHALTEPVAELFRAAWDHGVREFVLLQDTHDPATPEFEAYPPHCVAGTDESETIPELASLPFADAFTVITKNALNPAIATGFDAWLEANLHITSAIVVGDCTDLCTYQLAMHLRMRANALSLEHFQVVVPVNTVDTFHIPEGGDGPAGTAHPGDFFHEVFLYHMAQNGIRIVSRIQ